MTESGLFGLEMTGTIFHFDFLKKKFNLTKTLQCPEKVKIVFNFFEMQIPTHKHGNMDIKSKMRDSFLKNKRKGLRVRISVDMKVPYQYGITVLKGNQIIGLISCWQRHAFFSTKLRNARARRRYINFPFFPTRGHIFNLLHGSCHSNSCNSQCYVAISKVGFQEAIKILIGSIKYQGIVIW